MKHLKILMATMGLDLGGAETHIVELSKELKREGYDISAISAGGVYVSELTECGIAHYDAPLNRRDIRSMLRSYRALSALVKAERPDVVHAHARIPAFICSLVCKRYNVPMVTTAHFNFKTGGGLKFLTHWGKKSIAVSQDLKRYLIENYKLNAEDIAVTINGISTERFCAAADDGSLRRELSIAPDSKVVLTVSRMDYNACEAAFKLVAATEGIYNANKNLRVVIVGSGEALADITEKAAAVNKKLGSDVILVTGGRTDISRFCSMCDIFVGVSRAALEAMACERPTILAGNQGYLGLYTDEILDDCIKTNFTCRDIPYPAGDVIGDAVRALLATDAVRLAEIGRASRGRVTASYSVERMAGDAAKVYSEVQHSGGKKNDFLLCGYYGYGNAGDDAMLEAIVANLRKIDAELSICVLTKSLDGLLVGGVKAVPRFNPFAVLRAIKESRVLLFGGGNLIQDATSAKSLYYYLWLLRSAQRRRVPTMLYANGIGPISRKHCRLKASKIIDKIDIITLREKDSLTMLNALSVAHPYVEITADEVLSTTVSEQLSSDNSGYIALSLREWHSLTSESIAAIVSAVDALAEKFDKKIVLIPLQKKRDSAICAKISGALLAKSEVAHCDSPAETRELILKSCLVIGMRLHSLIFAVGCAVPSIGIIYDSKVSGFLNYIGTNAQFPCEKIDSKQLFETGVSLITIDEREREKLRDMALDLKEKASRNAALAISLLEGNAPEVKKV